MKNTKKRIVSALLGASILMSTASMASASQADIANKLETPGTGIIVNDEYDPVRDSKTGMFIQRLYRVCLGRDFDYAGLESWYNALTKKQATGIGAAYGFIYSNEFQSKGLSNGEYIDCMYEAFLDREADPVGKQSWVDALEQGYTREDIFKGFAESPEFSNICANYNIVRGDYYKGVNMQQTSKVNLFVNRLYELVLNRSCDPSGMTSWSQALITHAGSGAQAAYGMFFSPEFINRYSCNDCYVKILYNALLGRNATDAEVEAWSTALAQGASREKVFNGFAGSKEFNLICADYGIDQGVVNFSGNTKRQGSKCSICGLTTPTIDPTTFNIFSFNDEFDSLLKKYTKYDYNYVIGDIDKYQKYLDQILASGDNAPDIVVLDVDYNQKYANSDSIVSMKSIGISDSELSDMFSYAVDLGRDKNGTVKELSWCAYPGGVFYNTVVAQNTLGVSEPEQVAPYFATWDSVYSTAQTVSNVKDANGNSMYKAFCGTQDISYSYMGGHTSAWVVNGNVNYDSTLIGWAELNKLMFDEDLTANAPMWMSKWSQNSTDHSVLSYWGPLWMSYSLNFRDSSRNPTAGEWRFVPSPTPYYWGGTYLAVTKYCKDKTKAAGIIRSICLNKANLTDMTNNGEFVNSVSVMTSMSSSNAGSYNWLGGQNPYGYLVNIAKNIKVGPYDPNNSRYTNRYIEIADAFGRGQITNVREYSNYILTGQGGPC